MKKNGNAGLNSSGHDFSREDVKSSTLTDGQKNILRYTFAIIILVAFGLLLYFALDLTGVLENNSSLRWIIPITFATLFIIILGFMFAYKQILIGNKTRDVNNNINILISLRETIDEQIEDLYRRVPDKERQFYHGFTNQIQYLNLTKTKINHWIASKNYNLNEEEIVQLLSNSQFDFLKKHYVWRNNTKLFEQPRGSNFELRNADLANRNLTYVNLKHSALFYADFTNSDLSHSNFSFSQILNSKFDYTDMKLAKFDGAFLNNTDFDNATILNTSFANLELNSSLFFKNSRLINVDLKNSKLNEIRIINCKVSSIDLTNIEFRRIFLKGSVLLNVVCTDFMWNFLRSNSGVLGIKALTRKNQFNLQDVSETKRYNSKIASKSGANDKRIERELRNVNKAAIQSPVSDKFIEENAKGTQEANLRKGQLISQPAKSSVASGGASLASKSNVPLNVSNVKDKDRPQLQQKQVQRRNENASVDKRAMKKAKKREEMLRRRQELLKKQEQLKKIEDLKNRNPKPASQLSPEFVAQSGRVNSKNGLELTVNDGNSRSQQSRGEQNNANIAQQRMQKPQPQQRMQQPQQNRPIIQGRGNESESRQHERMASFTHDAVHRKIESDREATKRSPFDLELFVGDTNEFKVTQTKDMSVKTDGRRIVVDSAKLSNGQNHGSLDGIKGPDGGINPNVLNRIKSNLSNEVSAQRDKEMQLMQRAAEKNSKSRGRMSKTEETKLEVLKQNKKRIFGDKNTETKELDLNKVKEKYSKLPKYPSKDLDKLGNKRR